MLIDRIEMKEVEGIEREIGFGMFESRLLREACGKEVQIVSDFDETQCSRYVYSEKWKTHVPVMDNELVEKLVWCRRPICVATARGARELVTWLIGHKLTRQGMPVVAENGAVLVWVSGRISEAVDMVHLVSAEEIGAIKDMEKEIVGIDWKRLLPRGHELIVRGGRAATIELRCQEEMTKKGTPDDYGMVIEKVKEIWPQTASNFEVVLSGSSLGIQPRGVNKGSGLEAALAMVGVELDNVFLVGLGDNLNDQPMFDWVKNNGGLSLLVRSNSLARADFVFGGGSSATIRLIEIINQFERNNGWKS